MFERIGQQIYKFFLGGIVILLSVVFALQFGGPQAEGCVSTSLTNAATVRGHNVTEGDFDSTLALAHYAMTGSPNVQRDVAERYQLREQVLDGLVERTLLANRARELGYEIEGPEVWRRLFEDGTARFSLGVDGRNPNGGEIPLLARDEDGEIDREQTERIINFGLRRSNAEFAENQIDELLAQRMRETVMATVQVSPREVWDAFVRERENASIQYLRFSPRYYRDTLEPTPQQIDAWMVEHTEEIDREYEANQRSYENRGKQVRARRIMVRLEAGASEDVQTAAEERANGILARARTAEDFASLARRYSDNIDEGRAGGDLGWGEQGAHPTAIDEALFSMTEGEVRMVREERGFHILKVTAIRPEGTLDEAAARRDIAERLYREQRPVELAREAASRALDQIRSGKTLEEVAAEITGEQPESAEGEAEAPTEDPLASPNWQPNQYAPRAQTSRSFARGDTPIDGVNNAPLVSSVFDDLDVENPYPSEPLQLGDDFFVYKLEERSTAEREDFTDEVRQRLTDGLDRAKKQEALVLYIHQLRRAAERDNAISINEDFLRYGRDDETEGTDDEPAEEE